MSNPELVKRSKASKIADPSKGGKARAASLSPEERREIAQEAAQVRWGSTLPRAEHMGVLEIAGRPVSCAVLDSGKRLLTQETFMTVIGRAAKPKAGTGSERLTQDDKLLNGLPPFLAAANLAPFVSDELRALTTPFMFRTPKGVRAFGYAAELLPAVCDVYLEARRSDRLLSSQQHIADACELLTRALARVGIIALVDEATGYQEQRNKEELRRILEAYISEELRPWVPTFPEEFFKQVYRLHNWEYKHTSARTPYVGKLINKYIYDLLPPGVLNELRRKNPMTDKGYRKHKHHQFLADTGNEHLDKQITSVTLLMRVSEDKEGFENLLLKAFPGANISNERPLIVDVAPRIKAASVVDEPAQRRLVVGIDPAPEMMEQAIIPW